MAAMRSVWRAIEYSVLRPAPSLRARDEPQPPGEQMWQLFGSPLEPDAPAAPRSCEAVGGVDGAFVVADALTARECATLVGLAEALGFTDGDELVEVPRSVRTNDVAVLVVSEETAASLSRRLAPFVGAAGHGGARRCDPAFINRRWRCYRYRPPAAGQPAQRFGPHHDGAQPLSGVERDRLVDVEPARGVRRLSQMSVLLYLSEGHAGGETRFYPTGDAADPAAAVAVAPRAGAALCFWHGEHPLSPLHEGAPLVEPEGAAQSAATPKYVIRTEVMYATEAPPVLSNEWSSSSYARAMLAAAARS
jgi:hypothetical protein